jgi:Protein of unknown function (DUF3619)
MNQYTLTPTLPGAPSAAPPASIDALQARFALRVTAGLTERSLDLGADINERLRFAREQALERARAVRRAETVTAVGVSRGGAAVLGRGGSNWWIRIASVAPVLALIAGLVLIQKWQDNTQISAAAEVDAALLSDDLPPQAYSDAGFAEFLKTPTSTE